MTAAGLVAGLMLAPMLLAVKQLPDADPGDRCLVQVEAFAEAGPVEPEEVQEPQGVHENVQEPAMHLWANCVVTFYCPCAQCCGQWAGGHTASGTVPTAGRTVACGDLPFGTRIWLEGHEYIVEDRGVCGAWVDVFVNSHDEANARGMYTAPVYIID